jgi:uncharacterized protein YgfB (UPF0149 family)
MSDKPKVLNMVSQELIEELKTIIKEDYGEDLETKEVAQIAENLVNYFDLLAKIYHRMRYDNKNLTTN